MDFISTGKAAKMLSVTPDAVLKWVKAGKLPARQTAGGHYRVSLDAVKEIITRGGELPGIPQSSRRQREPWPAPRN